MIQMASCSSCLVLSCISCFPVHVGAPGEQYDYSATSDRSHRRWNCRRLFASGLIFAQKGARAGRDLLLAHQALLRTADLFARLVEPSARDDAALKHRAEEVFAHLDSQLARTAQLTARTGEFLSGRGRD